MQTYALTQIVDGVATALRLQHFAEPPPLLAPEKALEWVPFEEAPEPTHDALTEGVRALDIAVQDGRARRVWQVYPLPDEEAQARLASAVASQQAALWAAADAWQTAYISGVAIGLLTIGVLQGRPKALAVQAWSGRLWGLYYQRKATITPYTQVDTDFSAAGPMPYGVPELQAELGL